MSCRQHEHSTPARAFQSGRRSDPARPAREAAAAPGESAPAGRFGPTPSQWEPDLYVGGFTSFPTLLFRHYTALGIGEAELVLLLQLWTYWWDERAPFPSVGTLAERMGKGERQIQHYVEQLRKRGLLAVLVRRTEQGRQLSNAYDLRPLLARLTALVRASRAHEAACAGEGAAPGMQANAGMHGTAGGRVAFSTPEQDPANTIQENRSDPAPPTPIAGSAVGRAGPAYAPAPHDAPAIATTAAAQAQYPARIAEISARLGDDLPRASARRAERLLIESGAGEAAFNRVVEEASLQTRNHLRDVTARLPDGRPRGMPYFFATLERLLAGEQAAGPSTRRHARRDTAGVGREDRLGAPDAGDRGADAAVAPNVPVDGTSHGLWPLVREELRRTLPPQIFSAHVLPLRVRGDEPDALVIEAASDFEREWLARVLSRRIDQALRGLARPDVPVRIRTGAA